MKNFKSILGLIALIVTIVGVNYYFGGHTASGVTVAGIFPSMSAKHMREVFRKYNDLYNPATRDASGRVLKRANNFILEPSFLRLEFTLLNNVATYSLSPAKSVNADSVTENKLDRNDLFIAGSLSMFIAKLTTASPAKHLLQSYPNETVFGAAEAADLATLYNGRLSFKVGTKVNVESLALLHFLNIPETQQSAATNRSANSLAGTEYELPAEWRLRGDANNVIQVAADTYPTIAWASATAGTTNTGVLYLHGFLVKNFCTSKSVSDGLDA